MRVLIVGCGYVGAALGAALVKHGHTVVGVRRSGRGSETLVAAGIQPVVADITAPAPLPRELGSFDWVINAVASPFGGGVEEYRRLYLEGTRNLLSRLKTSLPQKYVYTSSTGVYGQGDGTWVDETSVTEPESPTARVLVETERELLGAAREWDFPAIILRLAGIYGPGRIHWVRQVLSGEARIPGDGTGWMNMVHRDDIVGAILAAVDRGQGGEVYNVCDDEPVRQVEFFRWLSAKLGRPFPPLGGEDSLVRRKRKQTNKRVSNRKVREVLGYELRYPSYREGYAGLVDS